MAGPYYGWDYWPGIGMPGIGSQCGLTYGWDRDRRPFSWDVQLSWDLQPLSTAACQRSPVDDDAEITDPWDGVQATSAPSRRGTGPRRRPAARNPPRWGTTARTAGEIG